MSEENDIKLLRDEIKSLKAEVEDLKEFVKAMYCMIADDDEDYDEGEFIGGPEMGRFNT